MTVNIVCPVRMGWIFRLYCYIIIDRSRGLGDVYKRQPENGQDENYAKARRAFLVGYDRSVPKLRQASHCIGCNQCVSHCPQNIDIPKELHRIDQFVEQLKQGTL